MRQKQGNKGTLLTRPSSERPDTVLVNVIPCILTLGTCHSLCYQLFKRLFSIQELPKNTSILFVSTAVVQYPRIINLRPSQRCLVYQNNLHPLNILLLFSIQEDTLCIHCCLVSMNILFASTVVV